MTRRAVPRFDVEFGDGIDHVYWVTVSGATPAAQNAAVMRKVGPEFNATDNEKRLDGSRPITEAIATRQGGDVPPERGKGARLRAVAKPGRKSAARAQRGR